MATRSNIIAKQTDGSYKMVYCHFDGYLDHNGRILLENYDTQEKIDQLLSHGNMSALKSSCEKPEGHSYETPVPGHTIYYGRDRGEEDQQPTTYATKQDAENAANEEYAYLWDGEKWTVKSYFSRDEFVDLKEAVANMADEEE